MTKLEAKKLCVAKEANQLRCIRKIGCENQFKLRVAKEANQLRCSRKIGCENQFKLRVAKEASHQFSKLMKTYRVSVQIKKLLILEAKTCLVE